MSDPPVRDDEQRDRYEIAVDGEPAGFVTYRDRGRERALIHTEIDAAFEGRGLASRLIRAVLDDARGRGLAVLPHCPFVRSFIGKHPEYADLVPEPQRERFGITADGMPRPTD